MGGNVTMSYAFPDTGKPLIFGAFILSIRIMMQTRIQNEKHQKQEPVELTKLKAALHEKLQF